MENELDFFFPDTCIIERSTGKMDEQGKELFEPVYEGRCCLHYGNNGNVYLQGMTYQTSPIVVIPPLIEIRSNDFVRITNIIGVQTRYTAEYYEAIKDEDVGGTTIWLKDGNRTLKP